MNDTSRTDRRPRPRLWLVEGLDIVERRRLLLIAVILGVAAVGALLAAVVPDLVPPVPIVGAAVGFVAVLLGLAAIMAVDAMDGTVRGPRHVKAAGGELIAVLHAVPSEDEATSLAASVLQARPGDGPLLLGLAATGRDARRAAALTDSLAVALVDAGVSVLCVDLASGRSDPPGLHEVVRDGIKFNQAVTIEPGRKLARLGAGEDATGALGAVASLPDRLPRDLDVLLVALPTATSRQVVGAVRPLDHLLLVAERDRTSRVDVIAALDAVESVGAQAQVALVDDRTAERLQPREAGEAGELAAPDVDEVPEHEPVAEVLEREPGEPTEREPDEPSRPGASDDATGVKQGPAAASQPRPTEGPEGPSADDGPDPTETAPLPTVPDRGDAAEPTGSAQMPTAPDRGDAADPGETAQMPTAPDRGDEAEPTGSAQVPTVPDRGDATDPSETTEMRPVTGPAPADPAETTEMRPVTRHDAADPAETTELRAVTGRDAADAAETTELRPVEGRDATDAAETTEVRPIEGRDAADPAETTELRPGARPSSPERGPTPGHRDVRDGTGSDVHAGTARPEEGVTAAEAPDPSTPEGLRALVSRIVDDAAASVEARGTGEDPPGEGGPAATGSGERGVTDPPSRPGTGAGAHADTTTVSARGREARDPKPDPRPGPTTPARDTARPPSGPSAQHAPSEGRDVGVLHGAATANALAVTEAEPVEGLDELPVSEPLARDPRDPSPGHQVGPVELPEAGDDPDELADPTEVIPVVPPDTAAGTSDEHEGSDAHTDEIPRLLDVPGSAASGDDAAPPGSEDDPADPSETLGSAGDPQDPDDRLRTSAQLAMLAEDLDLRGDDGAERS